MRLKSELYAKEQSAITDKIIKILDLEHNPVYTLYELDNNIEIQTKILALIPEIRKYYSFNNMKAVGEPHKALRPWLCIIKNLLKPKYNITSKDLQFTANGSTIRTHVYTFTKK